LRVKNTLKANKMSSENAKLEIADILERVGEIIGNRRNEAIAEAFDAAPSTTSNWRTRGTIPWAELYAFARKKGVNFLWLLEGTEIKEGERSKEDQELMDRYENIIRHYERIIESQSKQIDSLTKALSAARADSPPPHSGRVKKSTPF